MINYGTRAVGAFFAGLLGTGLAQAGVFDRTVDMRDKGASTYYVEVQLEGMGTMDFLVDTGSSYMTINEKTLAVLQESGKVKYIKALAGTMADGTRRVVPVYSISVIDIGNKCPLHNVEAAVFPGNARHILGLSVLRRMAPFAFSTDPPSLALSNCDRESVAVQTPQAQ